jgi:hypothetical protein
MAVTTRTIKRTWSIHKPTPTGIEDAARAMAALVHYGSYLKKVNCFNDYLEICMRRHGFKV